MRMVPVLRRWKGELFRHQVSEESRFVHRPASACRGHIQRAGQTLPNRVAFSTIGLTQFSKVKSEPS